MLDSSIGRLGITGKDADNQSISVFSQSCLKPLQAMFS